MKKINFLRIFKLDRIKKQVIVVVVLGIFIAANLLISMVSLRLDFSSGQAYTLSPATRKILHNLDNAVEIKFYVSSDLPTRLLPVKTEVTDFLNEFKKEGRGKISVKIIDPKKDTATLDQIKEIGIPELQFSQMEQNKYAVSTAYFGIGISYGSKNETIPQATDLDSLEYNLTAAIYKMAKKETVRVGYIGLDDLYSFKKILSQQFDVSPVDISSQSAETEIDTGYKTILLFDNGKNEYSQPEIDQLKKYLSKNGNIIFFVDGTWVLDNLQTGTAKHNLFSLIKDRGIEINEDLVLSSSAQIVNFGNETVQFYSPYPFWVKTNNFNTKAGYFSNINQLVFPWVSELMLKKSSQFTVIDLVKTNNKSWEQKDSFMLNPDAIPQPDQSSLKEFVIVAESQSKDKGTVVVIPSSRFIQERYLSQNADNLEFMLNIVNDLASGGALSGIRQRAVTFYPLPDLTENQKELYKYLNILLLPGLMAVVGGIRLFKKHDLGH